MKKAQDGILYDTETAERVYYHAHEHDASDASWTLYRKKDGSWFEVLVDHDGVTTDFLPLALDAVRVRLERNANHLVEKLSLIHISEPTRPY